MSDDIMKVLKRRKKSINGRYASPSCNSSKYQRLLALIAVIAVAVRKFIKATN
jgi:hypothetical protein